MTESAAAAGVDKRRFYELRAQDEAFAAEWEEANQSGVDIVEDELRHRAFGYGEETWDGDGNLLRRVRRKDTQALLAMARARRPEKFRDNMRVEHSGSDGGPIVTEHREKLTLEAAIELVAQRRQAAAASATQTPLELPAAGEPK